MARTFARVCPRCRMIQEESNHCRSCGETPPVPLGVLAKRRATLRLGNRSLTEKRCDGPLSLWDYAYQAVQYVAYHILFMLIVMGPIFLINLVPKTWLDRWWPNHDLSVAFHLTLALVGIASLVFAVVFAPAIVRGSRRLEPIPDRLGDGAASGDTFRGIARPLAATVTSPLSSTPALLVQLSIFRRGRPEAFLLREVRAAPFLLDDDTGDPLVVGGEVLLFRDSEPDAVSPVTAALLETLGLPPVGVGHAVVSEQLLRAGQLVEVRGTPAQEVVPEFARPYRDSGMVRMLRGISGAPLVVHVPTARIEGPG